MLELVQHHCVAHSPWKHFAAHKHHAPCQQEQSRRLRHCGMMCMHHVYAPAAAVVLMLSAYALSASGPASASVGAAVFGFRCEAAGTASAVPAGGAQEPSLPAKLC